MKIGKDHLCFLNLKISVSSNKLMTTVYSKPTDSHLYLHSTSCHKPSSINGIPKGVALRLRRICSTTQEYQNKAEEYSSYLVARGHNPKTVKSTFDKIEKVSRSITRKKKNRSITTFSVIFLAQFNPCGPNVSKIINKHRHLLETDDTLKQLFPKNYIVVANKRGRNLQELLTRVDLYNIKSDLLDRNFHGYKKCGKKCDSCNNFVDETSFVISKATGRKYWIRRDSTCTTKNVIYLAYCTKYGEQGTGSTVSWKPPLSNYKSHIKQSVHSCKIVKHFIEKCNDPIVPFKYLRFVILDVLTNTESLSKDDIEDLLLKKEKFWCGTLVTQHKGLNGSHDWNRVKRTEKPKE